VPEAAQGWASHNGCSATPTVTTPAAGATLTSYSPCHQAAQVELYTLEGAGHEWPGGPHVPRALRDVLGPQSHAVDANTTMWSFFEHHPLP
jgi:polyhydroxybutyrate depolymerase